MKGGDNMKDLTIKNEDVMKILAENMQDILKDVFTGYSSPIKEVFQQAEFKTELQEMAKKVFGKIINSPEFTEQLKGKLLESAVENMLRR